MSHGKPIIIKSGNGTANYIKDERGGFIVDSPEEFEKTLNLLFDHPDFIERSFNENLATVKELLDPESVASKLLNCAKYEVKM
jgi:glycosyltransferase involved in cell wall biosynthesis